MRKGQIVVALLLCGCSTGGSLRSRYPEISASLGGGFAGIATASVLERPVLDESGRVDTTQLDLEANEHHQWRPAVSTGIVSRWRLKDDVVAISTSKNDTVPGPSFGVGAHIVFIPNSSGATAPWPSLTFHVGNRRAEIFLGMIFSGTDEVKFPNGKKLIRYKKTPGITMPNFVEPSVGYSKHIFAGFELQGVRLLSPPG